MISNNPYNQRQRGVIAIETAFSVTVLATLLVLSYHVMRHVYWQQHFSYAADRLAKILVLNIQSQNNIDSASFDDALSLLQDDGHHKDFEVSASIYILSDNIRQEESFDINQGCKNTNGPSQMQDLTSVRVADINIIPSRYLLALKVCAQPKNWSYQNSLLGMLTLPYISQSYYPINHSSML